MPRRKRSIGEILKALGGIEVDEFSFERDLRDDTEPVQAIILTVADNQNATTEPPEIDDVENDPDDPNERPLRFDPETGRRLKPGSPEHATAAERFDIQQDEHYCIWCGESISIHYTGWSQWIDCGTLRRWRKGTARRTERSVRP